MLINWKKIFSEKYRKVFYWALFDFANTSFSITIVTFVYAVYFKETVANNQPIGDFYWSLGTGISMMIVALISPFLGAIADHSAGKKRFLLFFTLLCILSTASLYFIDEGKIIEGLILFILANIGFEAGLVFYDAFLPEISDEKNYGRTSGFGFAMGYIGSFASLMIVYPLVVNDLVRYSFPASALFFLIFSIPLFLFLPDTKKKIQLEKSYFRIGLERITFTIKHIKNYKNLGLFLLAFFFYIEGVNTAIYFSGIYAKSTLHFSFSELTFFFMIAQTTAVLGSILFGIIADSIGQKKTIYMTLIIWFVVIISASLIQSKIGFFVIGIIAGLGMGSTQSVSRSLMSKLTPENKKTEFFGFYSFFGKSSAIFGPIVFGFVSWQSGSQRLAILTTGLFFTIGMILLSKVKEERAT
ncbi:MAG: MFS transporter [Ignavibacteria bacterium]|nr:MFS transporter [Ignavibacteria bacterium]